MDSKLTEKLSNSTEDWLPCPRGTITDPEISLATRVVKRKSDVFSLGLIYLCGALIVGTVLLSWVNSPMRGKALAPNEISCENVRRHLVSYSEMKICDCQLRVSISNHLVRCRDCDLIYQELAGNHIPLRSCKPGYGPGLKAGCK